MFDELKILITGDTAGIATAVKKSLNIVQGGVKEMNKQEVDWTGIFSRAVSPAIISGVASIFAYAISQSMSFQTAMNQTGTAAGFSTDQIKATSAAALDMSKTLPSSAEDLGAAMAQISALFSTTADQQEIVAAMAQLAASGFGNLNDIVSTSVDLFRKWGVTTTADAITVLTQLMHGAEAAKESIPELAHQFASFDPNLAGAKLSDFNQILSSFSAEVQTIGAQGAQQIFAGLASGASDASAPMALLGGGVEAVRRSLKENGGLDVIQKVSNVLSTQFGNNVGLIAKNFGLSADNVDALINSGKQFPTIAANAQLIANNTQQIADAYRQSDSATRELMKDWNQLKVLAVELGNGLAPLGTLLGSIFVNAATDARDFFTDVSDGFSSMLSLFYGNNFKDAVVGTFKGLSSAFDDIIGKPAQQLINGIVGAATGQSASGLNSALQGSGVGFSSGVLGRIDKTASENGLIESLTSALQTGIKGGQYTQLVNTFHLNVPAGSSGLTAKMIAQQLYNQFQGTQ